MAFKLVCSIGDLSLSVDRSDLGGRWWLQGRTSSQLADTCVSLLKDLASVSRHWSLHRVTSQGHYTGSQHRVTTQGHYTGSLHRVTSQGHYTGSLHRVTTQAHNTGSLHKLTLQGHYTGSLHRVTTQGHFTG